jgi:glutathione peroxidase
MKTTTFFLFIAALFLNCTNPAPDKNSTPSKSATFYDLSYRDLHNGSVTQMSKYKGKKVLIVNTASECGNTPQYQQLEALSKKYADKLVIIGFPANDFGKQEPGDNKEIAEFCKKNYGVTFPMSEKITVKGKDMHPVYQWLTNKKMNGVEDTEVKWNFQKYLIDESGNYVRMFAPKMKPDDPEIIAAIEK